MNVACEIMPKRIFPQIGLFEIESIQMSSSLLNLLLT